MARRHVEGLAEALKGFDELPRATQAGILRGIGLQALEPMAATAREMAPDDPNTAPPMDLRSSIVVSPRQKSGRVSRNRREEGEVEVYMGPTREGYPQAIPQEFGAVQHPPHPYMRPAFQQHAQGVFGFVARALAGSIERAAKRLERRAARLARKG